MLVLKGWQESVSREWWMTDHGLKLTDVLFLIKCLWLCPAHNPVSLSGNPALKPLWVQFCVCVCDRKLFSHWGIPLCLSEQLYGWIMHFSGLLSRVKELFKKPGQVGKNTTDEHHSEFLLKLPLIMDLKLFYSWTTVYAPGLIAVHRQQLRRAPPHTHSHSHSSTPTGSPTQVAPLRKQLHQFFNLLKGKDWKIVPPILLCFIPIKWGLLKKKGARKERGKKKNT